MMEFRDNTWTVGNGDAAARLRARLPAFVPDWARAESGPGRAMLEIAGRYVNLIADRLARAPDKGKLALLDALGVVPTPAQAARCPVVFELTPGSGHGTAPARTRLGATPAAGGDPLDFETVNHIALVASKLIEVKASLPGDRFTDHSTDVIGGRPFTLFAGPRPVPRDLYLGHDRLFALTPGSAVEVQVQLASDSGPLPHGSTIAWEYWDGGAWVGFVPLVPQGSFDGTESLSRSGTIRLLAGERAAAPLAIQGITACWIRGRLRPPEATDDDAETQRRARAIDRIRPRIDRVRVRIFQSVGGLRVTTSKEKPVSATHSRALRVRLVDDSGAALAKVSPAKASPDRPLYSVADRDGHAFVANKDTQYFDLPSELNTAKSIELYVTSGAFTPGTILPDKSKQSLWHVPDMQLDPGRSYDFDLTRAGLLPEVAIGNGVVVDPTTTFQPFGPLPQSGAVFHVACPDVTSKPGARVTAFIEVATLPPDSPPPDPPPPTPLKFSPDEPVVQWEYWNGLVWAPLPELEAGQTEDDGKKILSFRQSGEIRFTVPANVAVKKEFGQEKPWLRARLSGGGYRVPNGGSVGITHHGSGTKPVFFEKVVPPEVRRLRFGYEYASPPEAPKACLSYDEFRWADHSAGMDVGGDPFAPFGVASDPRPTLYLGFTRPLPADQVSLFLDVASARPEPELAWEYSDGITWRPLAVSSDETNGLSEPGIVRFTWPGTVRPDPEPAAKAEGRTVEFLDARAAARFQPGDEIGVFQDDEAETARVTAVNGPALLLAAPLSRPYSNPLVGSAPPARFGTPRYWVRVVWPGTDAPQPDDRTRVTVNGIYPNADWAEQARTQENEILGSSTGVGGEGFDFARAPVLADEQVFIVELDGPRADAEYPVFQRELKAAGKTDADLRLVKDEKTGKVRQVLVRWENRTNFAGSAARDRHYVLERTRGRIQFGDGAAGMVPPPVANNVTATYRAGGGRAGNVDRNAVNAILGPLSGVQRVFNPLAAGGGADGELAVPKPADAAAGPPPDPARGILLRGPQLVRHRHRAVTAADYEQLALAASPGVAFARAVTAAETGCVVAAGSVRVVVVPNGVPTETPPVPTPQLRELVRKYLHVRAAAGVRVDVADPDYYPIGVEAVLVPRNPSDAGSVSRDARASIARFLHPVVGGPDGTGWGFGRAVHRSTLVTRLHRDLGERLAYVEDVRLLVDGVPVAEQADVPPDRLPAPGPITVRLGGDGGSTR